MLKLSKALLLSVVNLNFFFDITTLFKKETYKILVISFQHPCVRDLWSSYTTIEKVLEILLRQ